jgi:site-specific recombinase XerD
MPSPRRSAHPTIEAAITAYLDWQSLKGSSRSHRNDVESRLGAFADTLDAQVALRDISRDHCTAILRTLQEKGRKPNTVFAYYRVLEAFFNWLVAEDRLATSPMDRVPKPKVPLEQIKPLSEAELSRLLAAPDRSTFVGLRDCMFIALLSDTGLRLSEALGIRIADIDSVQRSISVLGKGSKPRTVFYGEAVAGMLKTYLKRRAAESPEERLFVNSLGEPLWLSSLGKRLRVYGAQVGIKGKRVSPHTLRHTFAVSWLMGGGDAFSLQRLLGHSTAVMTSRYVTFTSGDLGKLHRSLSPLDRLQTGTPPAAIPEKPKRTRLR